MPLTFTSAATYRRHPPSFRTMPLPFVLLPSVSHPFSCVVATAAICFAPPSQVNHRLVSAFANVSFSFIFPSINPSTNEVGYKSPLCLTWGPVSAAAHESASVGAGGVGLRVTFGGADPHAAAIRLAVCLASAVSGPHCVATV